MPKGVLDSVSAFANSDGGTVILGLDESAEFSAVDPNRQSRATEQRLGLAPGQHFCRTSRISFSKASQSRCSGLGRSNLGEVSLADLIERATQRLEVAQVRQLADAVMEVLGTTDSVFADHEPQDSVTALEAFASFVAESCQGPDRMVDAVRETLAIAGSLAMFETDAEALSEALESRNEWSHVHQWRNVQSLLNDECPAGADWGVLLAEPELSHLTEMSYWLVEYLLKLDCTRGAAIEDLPYTKARLGRLNLDDLELRELWPEATEFAEELESLQTGDDRALRRIAEMGATDWAPRVVLWLQGGSTIDELGADLSRRGLWLVYIGKLGQLSAAELRKFRQDDPNQAEFLAWWAEESCLALMRDLRWDESADLASAALPIAKRVDDGWAVQARLHTTIGLCRLIAGNLQDATTHLVAAESLPNMDVSIRRLTKANADAARRQALSKEGLEDCVSPYTLLGSPEGSPSYGQERLRVLKLVGGDVERQILINKAWIILRELTQSDGQIDDEQKWMRLLPRDIEGGQTGLDWRMPPRTASDSTGLPNLLKEVRRLASMELRMTLLENVYVVRNGSRSKLSEYAKK